jgi:hypothetical protein
MEMAKIKRRGKSQTKLDERQWNQEFKKRENDYE